MEGYIFLLESKDRVLPCFSYEESYHIGWTSCEKLKSCEKFKTVAAFTF